MYLSLCVFWGGGAFSLGSGWVGEQSSGPRQNLCFCIPKAGVLPSSSSLRKGITGCNRHNER